MPFANGNIGKHEEHVKWDVSSPEDWLTDGRSASASTSGAHQQQQQPEPTVQLQLSLLQ